MDSNSRNFGANPSGRSSAARHGADGSERPSGRQLSDIEHGWWRMRGGSTVLCDLPETATYLVGRSVWPDESHQGNLELVADRTKVGAGGAKLVVEQDGSAIVSGKRLDLEGAAQLKAGGWYQRLFPPQAPLSVAPWRMSGKARVDQVACPIAVFQRPRFIRIQVHSVEPGEAAAIRIFVDAKVVQAADGQEAAFTAGSTVDLFGQEFVVDFYPQADDTVYDVKGTFCFALDSWR